MYSYTSVCLSPLVSRSTDPAQSSKETSLLYKIGYQNKIKGLAASVSCYWLPVTGNTIHWISLLTVKPTLPIFSISCSRTAFSTLNFLVHFWPETHKYTLVFVQSFLFHLPLESDFLSSYFVCAFIHALFVFRLSLSIAISIIPTERNKWITNLEYDASRRSWGRHSSIQITWNTVDPSSSSLFSLCSHLATCPSASSCY